MEEYPRENGHKELDAGNEQASTQQKAYSTVPQPETTEKQEEELPIKQPPWQVKQINDMEGMDEPLPKQPAGSEQQVSEDYLDPAEITELGHNQQMNLQLNGEPSEAKAVLYTYRSNDEGQIACESQPSSTDNIQPTQNREQAVSPIKPDIAERENGTDTTEAAVMVVEPMKLQSIQPKKTIEADPSPKKSDSSIASPAKLVFVKNNLPEKPKNTGYFQSRVLSLGSKKEDDPFSVQNLLKQQQPNLSNIDLLPGEQIMIHEDASLMTEKIKIDGKIVFTNYQLCFLSRDAKRISVPLGYIGKLERTVETRPAVYSTIDVTMKMGTTLKFKFTSAKEISINIFKVMGKFIYCDVGEVFAFSHWKAKKYTSITTDPRELAIMNGWDHYNWQKEYKRMGVSFQEGSPFRIVANINGRLCVTYPEHFLVPAALTDEILSKSMKNRSRDRAPALSYAHHITKENRYVCLWRSSQMKFNVNVTRNLADQEYVKLLGDPTGKKQTKQKNLVVFDLKQRSSTVTMIVVNSNKACSFQPQNYKNVQVAVLEYDGAAAVRESYNRMIAACMLNESAKWVTLVEQSRWYEFVANLIKDSTIVAEYIQVCKQTMQNNESVLVQCSEGTDRTPQICSLVQIILDPYYRTIEGFAVLIEKEWVDFGHPFGIRLGMRKDKDTDDRSPIFLQFLDSVSQLVRQYPLSFEFTCKYLARVAFEAYTNRYGNFLCNSHSEQLEARIFQQTLSIWGQLSQENNMLYINPFFVQPEESDMFELRPNFSQKSCTLFRQLFLRMSNDPKEDYSKFEQAEENQDYPNLLHRQLRSDIDNMKKTLQTEQQELARLRCQLQELEKG